VRLAKTNTENASELRELVVLLHQSIEKLQLTIDDLRQQLQRREAENAELRRLVFGQSRERLPRMATPERELRRKQALSASEQVEKKIDATKKRKERAQRRKQLPTIDVAHSLEKCPLCQSRELDDLNSPEVSEEIEYVPAHFVRKRHLRAKKKCLGCKQIVTAEGPAKVTDGCHYGPGVHACAVVAKCADSIPLHRLSKRFARDGVIIERSTLNRLFHRTAELLGPIARRILERVVDSERVNADETPILIQAKEKCQRGYVWTFLADNLIAYVFSTSRSGETPKKVLAATTGKLQVDGYTGYNVVCVPDGRERVGCVAHARRKFFVALDSAPEDAKTALEHILSLYEVEYEAARRGVVGTAKHLALRRSTTKKRLDAMKGWMLERQPHHVPKSPMGMALSYALKMWSSLDALLDDSKVRLDNNLAENALRIIALGRKNFLFVGDEEGGTNLATLQTVVSTCIANGVNPEAYISDVLLRVADTPCSQIDTLLPGNWQSTFQATPDIASAK
jgi:transposase